MGFQWTPDQEISMCTEKFTDATQYHPAGRNCHQKEKESQWHKALFDLDPFGRREHAKTQTKKAGYQNRILQICKYPDLCSNPADKKRFQK
jgi:hypothetical protein